MSRHGDVLDAAKNDVFMAALRKSCKSIMDSMSSGEKQFEIEGISLPSAIAIKKRDGSYYYVLSDLATWPEVVAGRKVREEHVHAASASLESYIETMERLRPIMGNSMDMTVSEALQVIASSERVAS
jgi:hypothetical protein